MKKLAMISLLLATVLTGCNPTSAEQRVVENCKVNGKESVRQAESHQYRVYTTCGTFVVEDSWFLMRFDSADLYGSIEQHKTYDFEIGGYRNGFLSMFPNIIKFRESKKGS